jgi:hypothetical protein
MSRVLVRLTTNLNTLEERQFHQEVALYSFIACLSGFFAGTFAEISSLIKCAGWPTPFFFATFFFGGIEKKKVFGLDYVRIIFSFPFLTLFQS